ncbi:MAG TPA: hypothetical protein VHE83_08660 [Mycobacteriales bacterium]|nr:hypothetical protein [Mycobacteriales bacterium]
MPTATSPYAGVSTIGGCPVFPKTSLWNRDVSHDPVDPRSAAYISSIGRDLHLHADFGSGRYGDYGIAINIVGPKQKKVPIHFTAYGDESDKGPYPVPPKAHVEGGSSSDGDRHVLVVQQGSCKLYELYRAFPESGGAAWNADSGAVYDLKHPKPRPAGWTSADAAGLPIAPGLARAGEVASGAIRHALRVTVSRTQCRYVAPARHEASSRCDADLPPMGLRLRLKASFPLTGFHGQALVILKALKTYGLIVADNGSSWYISGTPDHKWDDDDLDQLKTVPGSAFEAVRSGPLHR